MLTAVLGGLLLDSLTGPSGVQDLLVLRRNDALLATQRDRLLAENVALRARTARLKSDDAYLQGIIRQELGYVRADDFVYRFAQPGQP